MSTALTVSLKIVQDTATPELRRIERLVNPGFIAKAVGPALKNCVTDNFRKLPANHMGFPTTGFWKNAVRATSLAILETAAVVTTNQIGVRQRLYGGDIEAGKGTSSKTGKTTQYLVIAARAEAYGKTPGMFNSLVPVFRRIGGIVRAIALAEASATNISFGRKRKDGTRPVANHGESGSLIMFWLKKKIHQEANPSVLPSEAQILSVIQPVVLKYLGGNVA